MRERDGGAQGAERLCQGMRADGSPCRARALPGRSYCWAHDPALREKRRAANSQGGRNKRTTARITKLMPESLKPTLGALFAALDEVHAGTLDAKQATAMASLAGAIGRLYEVAILEERLDALEGNGHDSGQAG